MTSQEDRLKTVDLIKESCKDGARLIPACRVVGISSRTYQRWTKGGCITLDSRPEAIRPKPSNQLTQEEKQQVPLTGILVEMVIPAKSWLL